MDLSHREWNRRMELEEEAWAEVEKDSSAVHSRAQSN